MFVLPTLERTKETRLTLSQGSLTILQKLTNYEQARVKLSNRQLKN